MPIFQLNNNDLLFPDPFLAEESGLLALGGDLSPQRLVRAYAQGIFPWYDEEAPILWWSPDPRCILLPEAFRVPKSLQRLLKKEVFLFTMDKAFSDIIKGCATAREGGTWLLPEMQEAYIRLHELGLAHSVEVWQDGCLAGGLYGVSLGRAFFGESMFFSVPNASKAALVYLVKTLQSASFHFIDCQQTTDNLTRFGAAPVPRSEFMARLENALMYPTLQGSWSDGVA